MVSQELIEILRCPHCVQEGNGELEYYKDSWFLCGECGRNYPIVDDIPVMLIDVGERFQDIKKEDLPIPPPADAAE